MATITLAYFYISIVFSSVYGLVLLWLREKTGSLLFPIVAHNATVFLGQLL
ncbi:CPBP family glutamic-type intramembrane protease [Colwellia sp. MT41]|uniref:CPBP family glutamic-type intramembrane protease n=1 Tax=Colwellia sp. MT41 TaxID=58049 RepID=UPI0009F8BA56